MSSYTIGVDLGGTNLRVAAVDEHGQTLERMTLDTELSLGRDRVIDDMCAAIQELTRKRASAKLLGIGIGVPGVIDLQAGTVRAAANLPGWAGFPVRAEIERRLHTQLII
jgi:glucokinase